MGQGWQKAELLICLAPEDRGRQAGAFPNLPAGAAMPMPYTETGWWLCWACLGLTPFPREERLDSSCLPS